MSDKSLSNAQSATLQQGKSLLKQKLFANRKRLPGSLIVELERAEPQTLGEIEELLARAKPYEHTVMGGTQ